MTCEVLVANRLGIALAADSAVTFSTGNTSEQATYAAGANKIFQLSPNAPVAAMIFNAANLQTVPWEVVLKAYRTQLGNNTFPTLGEYCSDLIDYINNRSQQVLPSAVREASTREAIAGGVVYVVKRAIAAKSILSDKTAAPTELATAWDEAVKQVSDLVSSVQVHSSLLAHDLPVAHAQHSASTISDFVKFIQQAHPHLAPIVDSAEVVRVGIESAFRESVEAAVTYSGIVVAGYGRDEFMPSFCCQTVLGFIGNNVCWANDKSSSVGFVDRASIIEPFAQKSMVETFTQGASPEVWKSVREAFTKHAAEVAITAGGDAGVTITQDQADAATHAKLSEFTTSWARSVFGAHLSPLHSVVASLDVESLAELAETLVNLESLKEKVTSRTQAVGGPIDLAVITKAEGLVWLKRKHYFNTDLNPRYLLRLQTGG